MKQYPSYKESGVEWICEIPSGWDMSALKYHSTIKNGFPFDSKNFTANKGFPLLRIRDITSGEIKTFFDGEFDKYFIVKKDDLLIGMDGDFNVRWWKNREILLNQRCCAIWGDEWLDKRYL